MKRTIKEYIICPKCEGSSPGSLSSCFICHSTGKMVTREETIEDEIYFAITHWDMNPMTKKFCKRIIQRYYEDFN